jgi:hypothetical protein
MRRLVVSFGVVAALGLTACGGGSGKSTAAATTTTPTTVAPVTTTVATGNDQAGTQFCMLAKTYNDKYNSLLSSLGDPTKLKSVATDAESAIRQAQTTAPAAIKADVTVVATTASQVLAALQKANFVFGNTAPAEVAKLQDPGFQASLARLVAYGQAHCGLIP